MCRRPKTCVSGRKHVSQAENMCLRPKTKGFDRKAEIKLCSQTFVRSTYISSISHEPYQLSSVEQQ